MGDVLGKADEAMMWLLLKEEQAPVEEDLWEGTVIWKVCAAEEIQLSEVHSKEGWEKVHMDGPDSSNWIELTLLPNKAAHVQHDQARCCEVHQLEN